MPSLRVCNISLLLLIVLGIGVFIGAQFLFMHLKQICDVSAPGYDPGRNETSHCSGNATRFDCAIGWAGVTTSIIAFGSFALPTKAPQVLEADVGPMVFQLYFSLAVFLTSFLVLITTAWSFTWWGVLSAAFWVPTSLLSLVAIKFIGISVGQAMWAGVTVVVSFIWGVAMFGETPHSIGLAVLGLILILVGIAGLSLCNSDTVKAMENRRTGRGEDNPAAPLLTVQEGSRVDEKRGAAGPPISSGKAMLFGILAAVGCGIFNGTMLVPTKLAARSDPTCEYQGMGFIVSFGIGVMLVTVAIAIVYHSVVRRLPVFQPARMLAPAMATGVMWSVGNFGSIFAAQYLGLAVGFPLTQTCLLVAGLWGLFLLRELRGLIPIALWSVSALVLLGGAAVLSKFG